MDTECGMPWDMADLGEVRAKVEALEQEVSDVNTYATDLGDSIDLCFTGCHYEGVRPLDRLDLEGFTLPIEKRLEALEGQQAQYACNIEPHAEDEAQYLSATITDTNTKEVYEGRLPLTNAGQPDPKPAPVICSPLTKMGLTAITDDQFRKMAEYVVAALWYLPPRDCRSEDAMVDATTDALQAYAKGDR
jgi:hypothetical protein